MRLAVLGASTESAEGSLEFSTNPYEYVGGDPIARIDPFGLDWIYSQSTGQLYRLTNFTNVDYVASGYSGNGKGNNNPAMQDVENVGPIPQGIWTAGKLTDNITRAGKKLTDSMRLYPRRGTITYDRAGFLIHRGDMVTKTSSTGCIILPDDVRKQIGGSGDRILRVVP